MVQRLRRFCKVALTAAMSAFEVLSQPAAKLTLLQLACVKSQENQISFALTLLSLDSKKSADLTARKQLRPFAVTTLLGASKMTSMKLTRKPQTFSVTSLLMIPLVDLNLLSVEMKSKPSVLMLA